MGEVISAAEARAEAASKAAREAEERAAAAAGMASAYQDVATTQKVLGPWLGVE